MGCDCNTLVRWPAMSRRALMAGGVAGMIAAAMPASRALAGGHCEALLLTCMDYRLTHEITTYMDKRGLTHKYDHVVLAGASLGALNDRFPHWAESFMTHIELAIQLHQVHRVIVIDHRDCGAYKMLLGEAAVKDAEAELKSHVKQLYALRSTILAKHPHMEVEIGLMSLDGTVMQIV
jgi:carbonic anhydrase